MIVVRVEMWPKGDPNSARELGRTYIANVTPLERHAGSRGKRGDYQVAVCRKGSDKVPQEIYIAAGMDRHEIDPNEHPTATRTTRVEGYPRESYNIWRLVSRALRGAFPEEK